ncbi:MAG: hypothetical protein HYT42_01435 [Candidatus Sungbacteria bacterium]|nr:hypothetical protein [Candidatus Sungbacteria bacterium]
MAMSEGKSNGRRLGSGDLGFAALIADKSRSNGLVWRVVGGICGTRRELELYVLGRNELFRATESINRAAVAGPRDVLAAYPVFPHEVLKAALDDGSFRKIEVD